jgi:hypothetical protein
MHTLDYIWPFVQHPGAGRTFGGMEDREKLFWGLFSGGSIGYLLLLATLYVQKRGKSEYWLKAGWKAGRKGKDWKKPLRACMYNKTAGFRPMDPNEALEWCGSVVATGHAAGAEGAPFKQVALPALSGGCDECDAFKREHTAEVDQFMAARKALLSGKIKGAKAKKLDQAMCALYHQMSGAEQSEIIHQSLEGKGPWVHVAGGCLVGSSAAACGQQQPCDDQFENKKLGIEASFSVPVHWHFAMRGKVQDLKTLERLPGVKLHKKYSIDK